jgi:L-iditol 2-dehydrogenase
LRIVGLSNHPFTGYRPSMELMLRYQDQMPLHTFVTHRFPLEQAQEAMDTALGQECMKVVFAPFQ